MRKALDDFSQAISKRRFWINFSILDIKQKYRGSILGPLWITISMAIFIFFVGLVYARLFNQPLTEMLPYLCAGFVFWNYMTSVLNESVDVFLHEKEFIDNVSLPFFCYIFKLFSRNIIIFLHNIVVLFFVLLLFGVKINLYSLLFIPGFILLNLNLLSVSIILAFLGIRYRDIPPIVNSMLTVAFFVSPITWRPEMLQNSLILKLNPISYFLDIVRTPLLGGIPSIDSYIVVSIFTVLGFLVSLSIFEKYKSRVAYWVV
tara:strand:- start:384 stop:1163 length:780 start_codon:yes stop_codon:yes gene_type:complete